MGNLPMTQEQGIYLSIAIIATIILVNLANGIVLYYKVHKNNNELIKVNENLVNLVNDLRHKLAEKGEDGFTSQSPSCPKIS